MERNPLPVLLGISRARRRRSSINLLGNERGLSAEEIPTTPGQLHPGVRRDRFGRFTSREVDGSTWLQRLTKR